jgi:predicted tellurium resistance membrane protein TerC
MDAFLTSEGLLALVTLTFLEIILGVDNVIFISILSGKLPASDQARARRTGLAGAMLMRIALLLSIAWVVRLTAPLFSVFGHEISGRDLILLGGGLFLMFKATREIYARVEPDQGAPPRRAAAASVFLAILQIMVIDVIFSLDSIITAVGVADHLAVMVSAMVIAVLGMMSFAGPVGRFINRHPSMKVLALAFLLLIGLLLVAEAFGQKIDRGYIYFAMGFAVLVEFLNLRRRRGGTGSTPSTV